MTPCFRCGKQSSARMGHNEVFDARIARIAIKRFE